MIKTGQRTGIDSLDQNKSVPDQNEPVSDWNEPIDQYWDKSDRNYRDE